MTLKENAQNAWMIAKRVVGYGVIGAIAAAYYLHTPSNLIASAPDRIIPADNNMAERALKPSKLEVKVCDAIRDQPGNEFVFVYDGKRQVATVGLDGYIVLEPFKGEEWWCR